MVSTSYETCNSRLRGVRTSKMESKSQHRHIIILETRILGSVRERVFDHRSAVCSCGHYSPAHGTKGFIILWSVLCRPLGTCAFHNRSRMRWCGNLEEWKPSASSAISHNASRQFASSGRTKFRHFQREFMAASTITRGLTTYAGQPYQ